MHCRNTLRTEAIANGSYQEFKEQLDARKYLSDLFVKNIEMDLLSVKGEIEAEATKLNQM
jgi:hypothetical protein